MVLPGLELPPPERVPYIMRPFDQELMLCRRYYWKSFPYATPPATGAGTTGAIGYFAQVAGVAGYNGAMVYFPVSMRVLPALTPFNPTSANAKWWNANTSADSGPYFGVGPSQDRVLASNQPQVAGDASGHSIYIHMIADARLPGP